MVPPTMLSIPRIATVNGAPVFCIGMVLVLIVDESDGVEFDSVEPNATMNG